MKTNDSIALISLGGSAIPFGNVLNDSRKYGNYNLEILSSYLKSRSIASTLFYYFNRDDKHSIVKEIINNKVFIFFADIYSFKKMIDVINEIKKYDSNKLIICFGRILDSEYSRTINEYKNIDYICLGNPSRSVTDMIDNGFDSKLLFDHPHVVSKISTNNKSLECFYSEDLIPVMDYYQEGVGTENKYKTYILTTRNNVCCGSCSFCLSIKGKYVYKRSEVVVEEVNRAVALGIRDFLITDNDLFEMLTDENVSRLNRIINGLSLIKEKITISCFAKSKTINKLQNIDPTLLSRFRKCGLFCIFLGVDAGNEIDKKTYNKGSSLVDDFLAIEVLNNNDIFVRIGFICDNPYSTLTTLRDNYLTLVKLKSPNIYHYGHLKLMLFPNTAIYRTLSNSGAIIEQQLTDYNVYQYPIFDKHAKKIIDFVDEIIKALDNNKLFFPFIYFKRLYMEALYLNKEKTISIVNDYNDMEEKEFSILKEFFNIVFIESDLNKAIDKKEWFINSIIGNSLVTKELSVQLESLIFEEKYHGNKD